VTSATSRTSFEEDLAQLDDRGLAMIDSPVGPGAILVGKSSPVEGGSLSPEELLRAIFGDAAGPVRDTSLRAPPWCTGEVSLARAGITTTRERTSRRADERGDDVARLALLRELPRAVAGDHGRAVAQHGDGGPALILFCAELTRPLLGSTGRVPGHEEVAAAHRGVAVQRTEGRAADQDGAGLVDDDAEARRGARLRVGRGGGRRLA
jgi:DNA-directed RNA polymerase beta subunit